MSSWLVWIAVVILAIVFLRRWFRWREYNALPPLQRAYRDWKKARAGNNDAGMGTAAKALNELVLAELSTEAEPRSLNSRYRGLIYWDADTKKYGKDVIDFYNAKLAELEQKERAERDKVNAQWHREQEAKESACLQLAQEATTAKEACAVYCNTSSDGPAEKLAREKWDRFSLLDVLHAKTVEELLIAKDEAREDSIGAKLVPFMHERLAKYEAVVADTINTIILAGENAPEEIVPAHTALRIVFEKLYERRYSISPIMS